MGISYLPVLQIRQECVLGFTQYQYQYRPPPKRSIIENVGSSGNTAYSGTVTTPAARRLQAAVDVMLQTSRLKIIHRPGKKRFPFRLGFATLTIPGEIVDVRLAAKVFASFTAWLRYTKTSYIWKAEFQQRGQIHYHLILNRYLPWKELQYAWNSRLKKERLLDSYAAKSGHFMPNSVDVRSVKMGQGKSLAKYLAKYLAKGVGGNSPQVIRKWWGCSRNLNAKRFVFEGDYSETTLLEAAKKVEGDNWVIYLVDPQKIMSAGTKTRYRKWQKDIRDSL